MTRDEYLKHHGILGQKWGRKAGPPYPLSPSDHTAAEKKAGYQKSIDKNQYKKDKKDLFNKAYDVRRANTIAYTMDDRLSTYKNTDLENLATTMRDISIFELRKYTSSYESAAHNFVKKYGQVKYNKVVGIKGDPDAKLQRWLYNALQEAHDTMNGYDSYGRKFKN